MGKPQKPVYGFARNPNSVQHRGLIAWYPGGSATNGRKLLNRAALAGRYNGTLSSFDNSAASGWQWGKDGGRAALWCDGTDDYVDLGDNFGGFTAITVSCWFLTTNIPGVGTIRSLVSKFGNHTAFDATDSWTIHYGTGEGLRWAVGGPNKLVTGGVGLLAVNTWYHACGTYDGVTVKLYQNGGLVGSTAGTGALNVAAGTTAYIAKEATASGTLTHAGPIEEVRIYNRALTQAEIWAMVDYRTRWDLRYRASARSAPALGGSLGNIVVKLGGQLQGGLA
jgi:hypothetical protein